VTIAYASVRETIAQHRVIAGAGAKQVQEGEDEQEPADGVTQLASRDNDAHAGVRQDDGNPGQAAGRQLVIQTHQRQGRDHQHDHQDTQDRRRPR
jgi:hypothetical protein